MKQNTSDILWAPGFAQRNLGYLPQKSVSIDLDSNTKLKIKHNDQSEKRLTQQTANGNSSTLPEARENAGDRVGAWGHTRCLL